MSHSKILTTRAAVGYFITFNITIQEKLSKIIRKLVFLSFELVVLVELFKVLQIFTENKDSLSIENNIVETIEKIVLSLNNELFFATNIFYGP